MRPSAGRCCMREQPARVAREQFTAGQRPLLHMHGRVRGEQDVVWTKGGLRNGGEVAHVGLIRANEAKLVLDLAADKRLSAACVCSACKVQTIQAAKAEADTHHPAAAATPASLQPACRHALTWVAMMGPPATRRHELISI